MSRKDIIKIDWKDRVCILTLNDPDRRNALDDELIAAFRDAVQEIKESPQARVLIVTGMGNSFSAGANLHMLLERSKADIATNRKNIPPIYTSIMSIMGLEIPTIAAINGPAIGVGASLSLLCDMRFAAADSRIGFTFVKLGMSPGLGTEYFLTRAIGPARTFELLMTGRILTAEEACRIGLVNQIFPADTFMEQVVNIAEEIAAMPVLPIKMLKQSIPAAMRNEIDDFMQIEGTNQIMCFASRGVREGVTAMIEKRPPRFEDEY